MIPVEFGVNSGETTYLYSWGNCQGNKNVSFELEDASDTWCTFITVSNSVKIHVDAVPQSQTTSRDANLKVKVNGSMCGEYFHVTQPGRVLCDCNTLNVERIWKNISCYAQTGVTIATYNSGTCVDNLSAYTSASWITNLRLSGGYVIADFLNNPWQEDRYDYVYVSGTTNSGNCVSDGIYVFQEACQASCDCNDLTDSLRWASDCVPSSDGTVTIATYKSNTCVYNLSAYTSTDNTCISSLSMNNGIITATFTANPTTSNRYATVYVSGTSDNGTCSTSHSVCQSGSTATSCPCSSLTVSSVSIEPCGGVTAIGRYTNTCVGGLGATTSASWISGIYFSNGYITANVDANDTGNERSATITITGTSDNGTCITSITSTQDACCQCELEYNDLTFEYNTGYAGRQEAFTYNKDCCWIDGLTVSNDKFLTKTTFGVVEVYPAQTNTTSGDITATVSIEVHCDGGIICSKTITVTQMPDGCSCGVLSASTNSLTWSYNETTHHTIEISDESKDGDCVSNVSVPYSTEHFNIWRHGDEMEVYPKSVNDSYSTITDTFNITYNSGARVGCTYPVTLTQNGKAPCVYEYSATCATNVSSINKCGASSTLSTYVYRKCTTATTWENVTSSANYYITLSKTSGDNYITITNNNTKTPTWTAAENTGSLARSATYTFSVYVEGVRATINGSNSCNVVFSQSAGPCQEPCTCNSYTVSAGTTTFPQTGGTIAVYRVIHSCGTVEAVSSNCDSHITSVYAVSVSNGTEIIATAVANTAYAAKTCTVGYRFKPNSSSSCASGGTTVTLPPKECTCDDMDVKWSTTRELSCAGGSFVPCSVKHLCGTIEPSIYTYEATLPLSAITSSGTSHSSTYPGYVDINFTIAPNTSDIDYTCGFGYTLRNNNRTVTLCTDDKIWTIKKCAPTPPTCTCNSYTVSAGTTTFPQTGGTIEVYKLTHSCGTVEAVSANCSSPITSVFTAATTNGTLIKATATANTAEQDRSCTVGYRFKPNSSSSCTSGGTTVTIPGTGACTCDKANVKINFSGVGKTSSNPVPATGGTIEMSYTKNCGTLVNSPDSEITTDVAILDTTILIYVPKNERAVARTYDMYFRLSNSSTDCVGIVIYQAAAAPVLCTCPNADLYIDYDGVGSSTSNRMPVTGGTAHMYVSFKCGTLTVSGETNLTSSTTTFTSSPATFNITVPPNTNSSSYKDWKVNIMIDGTTCEQLTIYQDKCTTYTLNPGTPTRTNNTETVTFTI